MPDTPGARALAAALAGRKPLTAAAYTTDLASWAAWRGQSFEDAAAELFAMSGGEANEMAGRYIAHLGSSGLAPATVARRYAALRSLVKAARVLGLTAITLEVAAPRTITLRDTRGLGLDLVHRAIKAEPSPRNRAILRLMADLGLRRGEVVSLDLEHLELARSRIMVMGKARTERAPMTLPGPTIAALRDWLAVRGFAPGPLFTNAQGGRLTGRSIATITIAAGERVGATRPLRPHGIRHSAITAVLDATGGDLRRAQKFSRHANPATLIRYDDARRDDAGTLAGLIAGDVAGADGVVDHTD